MQRNGLMILGLGLLLAVVVLMLTGLFPDYLAYLVLGMSALTFLIYARDKTAAEKGRQRMPENTLHLLALLGGWPGALVAQQGFRHKNRKMPFQALFWLTVAVNLALVWFLVAEDGLKGLL